MTAIEIIALITVLIVIIKLIVLAIKPSAWYEQSNPLIKIESGKIRATIFSLTLSVVLLYYLLQELTIVQIFAVMTFVWAMFMLALAPFAERFFESIREFAQEPGFLKKNWFSITVWIILVIWVVLDIFN